MKIKTQLIELCQRYTDKRIIGSLIKTDSITFFIALSIGKVEIKEVL